MSAEIIDLAEHRPVSSGNGAREALIDMALTLPTDTNDREMEMWSDWILVQLWLRGYKVVPFE